MAESRVLERLDELYAIGGGPGANRIGDSVEEQHAHYLAAGWLVEAGLAVDVDTGGNLIGRSGRRPDIWTGSHLDTVPHGGKFDGALGVVAGIEAVERSGVGSVVAFRDEERGCVGSRARVAAGDLPSCFVEVHVEQGRVLDGARAPLGLVTGIAGIARGELVAEGRAGHAGTTPMADRDDALVAAAELVLRVRDIARSLDGAVATVGRVEVEPGYANVIPARVRLAVDARAPDASSFTDLIERLAFEPAYRLEPVAMAEAPTRALREELDSRELPAVELCSGAGHDAGVLAAAGVPAAMLFVRSGNGGVSHSPEEHSEDADVELAVEVLAGALTRLAG